MGFKNKTIESGEVGAHRSPFARPVSDSVAPVHSASGDPSPDPIATAIAAAHRNALAAATEFITTLRRDTERALATRGLAAVQPLIRDLTSLATDLATEKSGLTKPTAADPAHFAYRLAAAEAAYAAAQQHFAEAPPHLPASGWRLTSHAPAFVALGAVGLGPLIATRWPAPDLAPYGGTWLIAGALSLGLVGLGALTSASLASLVRKRRTNALQRAFEDRELAKSQSYKAALAAREARIASPALNRVAEAVADLITNLTATSRAIDAFVARTSAPSSAQSSPHPAGQPAPHATDPTHDLLAALEPPVEPWLDTINSELARDTFSPTLANLEPIIRRALLSSTDWRRRRDLADRLVPPSLARLVALDAELRHIVPSGQPALRLALMPAALMPSRPNLPDALNDVTLAASHNDLHLLYLHPLHPSGPLQPIRSPHAAEGS